MTKDNKSKIIEEVYDSFEKITLEELQENPDSRNVSIAFHKGYFEAMRYCTKRLDKI